MEYRPKHTEREMLTIVRALVARKVGDETIHGWPYDFELEHSLEGRGKLWWRVYLYPDNTAKLVFRNWFYVQILDERPDVYLIFDKRRGRFLGTRDCI